MFTLIKTTSYFVFTALGFMALGTPLLAHHFFEAESDRNKVIHLTGAVTLLEFRNFELGGGEQVFAGSSAEGSLGQ